MFKKTLMVLSLAGAVGAHAGELNGEASLVIHESDITRLLKSETAKLLPPNLKLADQINLTTPYQATIKGLTVEGGVKLDWTKSPAKNVWGFAGQAASAVVKVASLDVHDTINYTIGGSTFAIRIDLSCSDLSLSFPGDWRVSGQVPVSFANNQLQVPVQNLLISMPAQPPVLAIGSCNGPSGIAPFLNGLLAQFMADQAKIKGLLATQLQKMVDAEAVQLTAALGTKVAQSYGNVAFSFTPNSFQNLASGTWILDGALRLQSPSISGTTTIAKGYAASTISDVRSSGIVFGNGLLEPVLGFLTSAGLFQADLSSKDLKAFQSFLGNRLQQFVVWPDLMNFDEKSVFAFHLRTTAAPVITQQQNLSPGVGWSLSVPVDAVMSAPSPKGLLPYAEFYSSQPASISMTTTAKDGALEVVYSVNSLPLYDIFRPEYKAVRNVSSWIAVDLITGELVKSLSNQKYTFSIPDDVSPISGYKLGVKDLVSGKKTFRMELSLTERD